MKRNEVFSFVILKKLQLSILRAVRKKISYHRGKIIDVSCQLFLLSNLKVFVMVVAHLTHNLRFQVGEKSDLYLTLLAVTKNSR